MLIHRDRETRRDAHEKKRAVGFNINLNIDVIHVMVLVITIIAMVA